MKRKNYTYKDLVRIIAYLMLKNQWYAKHLGQVCFECELEPGSKCPHGYEKCRRGDDALWGEIAADDIDSLF